MKKLLCMLLTVATVLALSIVPAMADEAVEINMFIPSPEYADAVNELIAAYKEVAPNVTINYETTQNDYPTLLKSRINAGTTPDIFGTTSGKEIADYAEYSYNFAGSPAADLVIACGTPRIDSIIESNGHGKRFPVFIVLTTHTGNGIPGNTHFIGVGSALIFRKVGLSRRFGSNCRLRGR